MQQQLQLTQKQTGDSRDLKFEDTLLKFAFAYLYRALSLYPQFVTVLYTYPSISEMIRIALIDIETDEIKKIVAENLNQICIKLELSPLVKSKPSFYFMNLYINDCLEYALTQGSVKTRIFFESINFIWYNTEIHSSFNLIRRNV